MKQKVLNWAKRFSTFCFLDNHQYQVRPHSVECLLAAGVKRELSEGLLTEKADAGNALQQLQEFIDSRSDLPTGQAGGDRQAGPGWLFGHLAYDLKNEVEQLSSANFDGIGFPDLYFFEPEVLVRLDKTEMIIGAERPTEIYKEILNESAGPEIFPPQPSIQNRFSKEEYIDRIGQLKQHILRGDCYEINFCQEFFAEGTVIDPVSVYKKLSAVSPNPFSALYKNNDRWLICASPERFLKREGKRIVSQPIKGTSERIIHDEEKDKQSRDRLAASTKDRSENVMVVDLVRNDLSKVCKEGTVKADELYGIYSFPQVHQMISTVSGEPKEGVSFTDIIRATFPMGSMTGAPKKRVMELIEQYERTKRGIFSGALGYISPGGDFDLNVVIRSIMYNAATKYLSFQAGSAITWYSDPEKEWEECLLKAEAIKRVLTGKR